MDLTTSIQRFLIKSKTSGSIDTSDILNRELLYESSTKSIMVKDITGTTLYRYPSINDSTTTTTYNTWSNSYAKTYTDNLFSSLIKPRTIILPAASITPTYTSGCDEPLQESSIDIPKVSAIFTSGEYGYWNISVPGDYIGSTTKISLLYSGPTNICTWAVDARVVGDNESLTSGGAWSSIQTLTDTPNSSDTFQLIDTSGTFNLLGSSSNKDKFCVIRLRLQSGSGTFKLYQLKIEYPFI